MRSGTATRLLLASMMAGATAAMAASPASGPMVAALGQIEPGQWQLQEVGGGAGPRIMCIADSNAFIQIQHPGMQCSHFVIDDQPRSATVHYTCPGAGHGRTTIKLEGRDVFHIDTQGIAEGSPFDMAFKVKRMGDCAVRH